MEKSAQIKVLNYFKVNAFSHHPLVEKEHPQQVKSPTPRHFLPITIISFLSTAYASLSSNDWVWTLCTESSNWERTYGVYSPTTGFFLSGDIVFGTSNQGITAAVFHSFLLAYRIPLYKYAVLYLPSLRMMCIASPRFWILWGMLPCTSLYMSFKIYEHAFLLGLYVEANPLGHRKERNQPIKTMCVYTLTQCWEMITFSNIVALVYSHWQCRRFIICVEPHKKYVFIFYLLDKKR